MAEIQIWTRDVEWTSLLGGEAPQHTFLIKVNDDGTREILRGGPIQDNMITDDIALVKQEYNDIKQSDNVTQTYDFFDPLLPNTQNYQGTTIKTASQEEIDDLWNNAWNKAQEINAQSYDYEPLTQNCNTTTSVLADVMGLKNEVQDFLLQVDVWTPGFSKIEFEHSLIDSTYDFISELPQNLKSDLNTVNNWLQDFIDTRQYEFEELKLSMENRYDNLISFLDDFYGTSTNQVSQSLQSAYQSFADAVANSIPPKDPLIIDLNNDGINLTSWQESAVRFDLDGDGTTESTGWTQASANIINYQKGDGAIIIDKDTANLADQIVFGSGISKDNLTFSKVEFVGSNIDSDLVISFNDSNNPNDKITIINYFRNPENGYENGIETQVQIDPFKIDGLKFSDGSSFSLSDLKYQINGTSGSDSLFGIDNGLTSNQPATFIEAGDGDDYISNLNTDLIANGGSGSDYFNLGNGNNKISGGDGNDQIYMYGDGSSIVYGGNGRDTITTDAGSNIINAGSGDDTIYLGYGNQTIYGGSGSDYFYYFNYYDGQTVENSTDIIKDFKVDGEDKIVFDSWSGISLEDLNIRQEGDNTVIEIYNKKVILENVNYLDINESHFIGLRNENSEAHGGAFDDYFSDYAGEIKNFYGGAGNDSISVYDNINAFGEDGDDNLTANGTGNVLSGGSGSDRFYFEESGKTDNLITDFDVNDLNEKIILSTSSNLTFADLLITDSAEGAVVSYDIADQFGGSYTKTITLAGVLASQLSADNFETRNHIQGSSGNDTITFSDNNGKVINANGGDDVITLGGGDDIIYASQQGDKIINTGAGNDSINGQGSSYINGEDGNDRIYYSDNNLGQGKGFELRGGNGDDEIDSYSSSSFSANNDRKILGEAGNDSINIQWGSELEISGGQGDDVISGGAKNSQIHGDDDNDHIILGSSNSGNEIFGDDGNDAVTIRYGANNNQISGGQGDDLFIVREASSSYVQGFANVITDFEVNNLNEKIDFQFRDIEKFEDLQISQNGSDAVVTFGEGPQILTLKNVDASQLSADNFIFKSNSTSGNDVINANNFVNNVEGGLGNDIISVSGSENSVSGGAGNDIFIIEKNPNSKTTINDFSTTSSFEKIQLKGFGNITFDDLEISYYEGEYQTKDFRTYEVYINLGDGQKLTILDVPLNSLTTDKFLFADLSGSELDEFNNSVDVVNGNVVDPAEKIIDNESNKTFETSSSDNFINIASNSLNSREGELVSVDGSDVNDDVFLVVDKNQNGNVDDITELFGNSSQNGFEELRKYDSNADNKINSSDSQFDLLKIWNDQNANGGVDGAELTTLAENNISEIDLNSVRSSKLISGNLVNQTSTVTFSDGSVGTANEVFFATDKFNSSVSNADEALGPDFIINTDALTLPYSRGYGELNSWQVAMTLDLDLLDIAQNIASLQANEFYNINSLFEEFLYKWAGVEGVENDGIYQASGAEIEKRKVAFLEKITGLDFQTANQSAILQAQTAWSLFYNSFSSRFLVQSIFKDVFPDATYSFETDTIELNITLDEAINNINAVSETVDKSGFINFVNYAKVILQLNKDQFYDADFDIKLDSMISDVVTSVAVNGFNFDGAFNIGDASDEDLYGSEKSDIIDGQDGSDSIYAGGGNDYIEGGKGNDYLKGEAGNDIYKFSLGDGQDIIEETAGSDKILFGSGITRASLVFAKNGNDLIINVGSNGDQIGIKNFYLSTQNKVETIEFDDGSQFNLSTVGNIVSGTSENDVINGSSANDIISGNEGDDTIYGFNGDDTLQGGQGNDYFEENHNYSGNDTYIFNLGDGADTIYDFYGNDKILFGEGITKDDITLIQDYATDRSLIIKVGDNGDQIKINMFFNYFDSNNYQKIESLEFADGSTMSLVNGMEIIGTKAEGETIVGTAGADIIVGNVGNDVLYGAYGNDVIEGGKGDDYMETDHRFNADDTYVFNMGDGKDTIYDFYGNDKILFGEGITKDDITLIQDYATDRSLIIKIGDGGDQIKINMFFNDFGTNNQKIESLEFADGSTMSLVNGLEIIGTKTEGETIVGTAGADIIVGNVGNDVLYGAYGNDVIEGGKGDDYMETDHRFNADDTYVFNMGDGQDTIYDYYGNDKIIFGEGIAKDDITLVPDYATNKSLIVKVGDNGDQIRINNFFNRDDEREKIESIEFADGSTINLTQNLEIVGTNTNGETLVGTYASDIIKGNDGNDAIFGYGGNDILEGGKGDDYSEKSSSYNTNDTYIFNLGDGSDTIYDYSGNDKILFGDGITKDDITLVSDYATNKSLIVKVGDNGDQIRINNFFNRDDEREKIESIEFADGSTINLTQNLEIVGTNTNGETLVGTYASDIIKGNDGNDSIYGIGGDDTLQGGKGDDYFEKSSSYNTNDTYIFNLGDGADTIYDYRGNDKILFGDGIAKDDITIVSDYATNKSLIVKVGDNGDQIRINNFFNRDDEREKIKSIEFADGSALDLTNGIEIDGANLNGETLVGTYASDIIKGNDGNDSIYGIGGDDTLQGGKGDDYFEKSSSYNTNDTYIFNLGDGSDTIYDYRGNDKILFGDGITKDDITLVSDYATNKSLIVKVGDNGDQIRINNFFDRDDEREKIESIEFADGSVLDLTNGIEIIGTNQDGEVLRGTYSNDSVIGADGNDSIYGIGGDDILEGGKGDDYFEKSSSYNTNDTYIFNLGDGADTIYDHYGSDKIIFGNNIKQEDIEMSSSGSDLILKISGTSDQIQIRNFFNGQQIEYLEFVDGTSFKITDGITISGSELNDKIIATPFTDNLSGNGGDDYIYAGDGNNIINGGSGNDNLRGGINSDVYKFAQNHGSDVVFDYGGVDTISFDSSVTYQDLMATREGNNLKLSHQSNSDIINIQNFFAAQNNRVEYLEFSDGTKFDLSTILGETDYSYSFGNYTVAKEDVSTVIKIFDSTSLVGEFLNISSIVQPANGNVVLDENGHLVYTSNQNFNGQDSFEVSYVEQGGNITTRTINLDVIPTNDAPTATDGSFVLNEDNPIEIDSANLSADIDGNTLSVQIRSNPSHGFIRVENGKIIYTPHNNFNGEDSFEYRVSDGSLFSETKTISLDVLAVNDAPVAGNDFAETDENKAVSISITNNDADVETGFFDGDSIRIVQEAANGSIEIQTNGKIYYTPNADYYGLDNFKYVVIDSEGLESNVADVAIAINIVNSAPRVLAGNILSFNEDEAKSFDISDYFYDREGDEMTLISASANNGSIQISGSQISYISNQNFNGNEKITVTIKDANGLTATHILNTIVNNVNDAPVANDDSFTVNEDAPTKLFILNNDQDIEDVLFATNLSDITQPVHGTLSLNSSDGSLTYTPNQNYNGLDSFSYTITDSKGLSSSATVSINVKSINDAPIVSNVIESQETKANSLFSYLLSHDSFVDVDGDNLTYSATLADGSNLPSWLSFDSVERKFTGTPPSNSNNVTLSIIVKASDGLATASQVFALTVIKDLSTINGSQGNDMIYGTQDDDEIYGKGGNDVIYGQDGNDKIYGNSNKDTIYAGNGNDLIHGGNGNDTLYGQSGNDTIYGGDGHDDIYGQSGNDIIYAGNGQDKVRGGDGEDIVYGGNHSDIIYSGDGADKIYGEDDNDMMDGGRGNDIMSGGNGADRMYGDNGHDIMYGDNGNDMMHGGNGRDLMFGGNGDDKIRGNDGDDRIYGNNGRDSLFGQEGDDILAGGLHSDRLTGGGGKDIFVFETPKDSTINYADLITDFEFRDDKIDLSDLDLFESIVSISEFQTNQNDTSSTLVYRFENNETIIENQEHDFQIKLSGNIGLTNEDFIF